MMSDYMTNLFLNQSYNNSFQLKMKYITRRSAVIRFAIRL